MSPVRYVVTATLAGSEYLNEYVQWLSEGHLQAIVDQGGALFAEIVVLTNEHDVVKVASHYTFPDQETLQNYFDGLALTLRQDGITRFVDTKKVLKFERSIGDIQFKYEKQNS